MNARMRGLFGIVGFGLLVVGVGTFNVAAGLIVAGLCCLAIVWRA